MMKHLKSLVHERCCSFNVVINKVHRNNHTFPAFADCRGMRDVAALLLSYQVLQLSSFFWSMLPAAIFSRTHSCRASAVIEIFSSLSWIIAKSLYSDSWISPSEVVSTSLFFSSSTELRWWSQSVKKSLPRQVRLLNARAWVWMIKHKRIAAFRRGYPLFCYATYL